jgi:hypothetical protein
MINYQLNRGTLFPDPFGCPNLGSPLVSRHKHCERYHEKHFFHIKHNSTKCLLNIHYSHPVSCWFYCSSTVPHHAAWGAPPCCNFASHSRRVRCDVKPQNGGRQIPTYDLYIYIFTVCTDNTYIYIYSNVYIIYMYIYRVI